MGVRMNLRILKKLSKMAATLLPSLPTWHAGESFIAERNGGGSTDSAGHDRKHWDRCRSVHDDAPFGGIVIRARAGGRRYPFLHLHNPSIVWAGTPMVGWWSGYETREWEERTAWEELSETALSDVTDYVFEDLGVGGPEYQVVARKRLANPAAILRHARTMAVAKA